VTAVGFALADCCYCEGFPSWSSAVQPWGPSAPFGAAACWTSSSLLDGRAQFEWYYWEGNWKPEMRTCPTATLSTTNDNGMRLDGIRDFAVRIRELTAWGIARTFVVVCWLCV